MARLPTEKYARQAYWRDRRYRDEIANLLKQVREISEATTNPVRREHFDAAVAHLQSAYDMFEKGWQTSYLE